MTVPALFAAFETIWIVNLPSRTDRRARMEAELAALGLQDDPRVRFFPAIVCRDPGPFRRIGSHGAFRSHLALLEQAAEAGAAVLILQDDCQFLRPAIDDYRLPADWDIFYGGYVASNPDNLAASDIIGAHFMGFSARAARIAADYLARYLQPDFPPDAAAAQDPQFDPAIRPPIDGAFVWMRRAHPELTTVFALLGVQRPSRTDIGDRRWFDQVPGLRWLAERTRAAMARIGQRRTAMRPGDVRFGGAGPGKR